MRAAPRLSDDPQTAGSSTWIALSAPMARPVRMASTALAGPMDTMVTVPPCFLLGAKRFFDAELAVRVHDPLDVVLDNPVSLGIDLDLRFRIRNLFH